MVIDSSALLAIVLAEPDATLYIEAIDRALQRKQRICVPVSVILEAGIVADRRGRGQILNTLLERLQPEIPVFDQRLTNLSRHLFWRYGRGQHAASLNFGDCMSYAAAEYLGPPLLFKGEDFSRTPVTPALPQTARIHLCNSVVKC